MARQVIMGQDSGGTQRIVLVDTSGRVILTTAATGATADGIAGADVPVGNPVLLNSAGTFNRARDATNGMQIAATGLPISALYGRITTIVDSPWDPVMVDPGNTAAARPLAVSLRAERALPGDTALRAADYDSDNLAISNMLIAQTALLGLSATGAVVRVRAFADSADGVAAIAAGALVSLARLTGLNEGGSYDRIRALGDNVDGIASAATGALVSIARLAALNAAGTYDRVRALGDNADGVASAATGSIVSLARLTGLNAGGTYDRVRALGDNADGIAAAATGALVSIARLAALNAGGTYDRVRALGDNADGIAAAATGALAGLARLTGLNAGGTWDRIRALGDNADGIAGAATGAIVAIARLAALNAGGTYDRLRQDNTGALRASLYGTNAAAGDAALAVHGQYGATHATAPNALAIVPYLYDANGAQMARLIGADAVDSLGVTRGIITQSFGHLYNGTGYDSARANIAGTVLASLANTQATRTSADQTNYNARGAIIHVAISAYAGAPTFTPSVQMKAPNGAYVTIWTGAALNANGDYTYMLYPGASGGSFTAIAPICLPREWRFVLTAAGAGGGNDATTLVDLGYVL